MGHLPSDIVILVSAEEDDNYYRLLDDIEEDRVSIREAVPSGGLFWRRRYNPISERSEWDTDVSGGEIARTFIQEVLGKLGLV